MEEKKEYYIGIDEAGRGPVIGPMIIAAVLTKEKIIKELKKIGVKDSKKITPKKRELLKKIIEEKTKYNIKVEFKPKEIDEALNSEKMNLNKLEAKGTATLINKIIEYLIKQKKQETIKKIKRITIDLPSNNEQKYLEEIKEFLKKETKKILEENKIKIHLEHKADEKYIEVSAASIIAKVERDKKIEEIKKNIKKDIGSGYPSDPKTKKFLEKHSKEEKKYIRKTWSSYTKIYGETKKITNKTKNNIPEIKKIKKSKEKNIQKDKNLKKYF